MPEDSHAPLKQLQSQSLQLRDRSQRATLIEEQAGVYQAGVCICYANISSRLEEQECWSRIAHATSPKHGKRGQLSRSDTKWFLFCGSVVSYPRPSALHTKTGVEMRATIFPIFEKP